MTPHPKACSLCPPLLASYYRGSQIHLSLQNHPVCSLSQLLLAKLHLHKP